MNDDVPAATKRARRDRLMRLQAQNVAERHEARVGETTRVMIDGPSPDSPLVLQGRLEGQAPDIDAVVYLDDCDPTAYTPGTVIDVRLTDARAYDFMATPLPVPEGA
jgi:ribosomal protein S12 methylthiotransferase